MNFELLAGMEGGQGDSLDALTGAADRTGEAVEVVKM